MSTKTTDGPLLATVSPFTTSQTTVTLSSPVISSTTATPVTTPKQGEVQPLNDVFVSIESVQPGRFASHEIHCKIQIDCLLLYQLVVTHILKFWLYLQYSVTGKLVIG